MTRDDEIFADALDVPEVERAAFLDRACAGDAAQRERIEALLRGLGRVPEILASPATPQIAVTPEEQPSDKIGRYKLLEKIGVGGCGVVWMAEQTEPVCRRVAVKVIKLGMDTQEVIARFEAERQALALMDHPNIAKIHDAGTTATGRPFFVMELVRGIPITRYCDENNLPTAARLQLFIQVCHAIQHAHQKGIIHRDIKPSNILVAQHDDVAVPKVIDFGIAKATQGPLTEATVFTAFEQFIGTPAYMSPEQAEFSGLDIDTRSDIYSLGVLLYELLTGKPPFDPKSMQKAGLDEIRRIIREVEPPRPSTRLNTLTLSDRTTLAKLHGTQAAHLTSQLKGDLDWIVMKSLEKNRTRRYETANGFARDIERHLGDEPITARPPSAKYLLQKLVRRHRFAFAASAAMAAVLVVGATVSTWQAVRARRAEREATAAQQLATAAEQTARRGEQEQTRLREVEAAQRQRAEAAELAARRRGYASDMNLIQQALAVENLARAQELLDRQRPKSGESDLRDWEWRYLWQFCRSDALFVFAQKEDISFRSLTVSSDGAWLATGEERYGGLSVWNLDTKEEVRVSAGRGRVRVAFSPREPLLAIAGVADTASPSRVWFWNLKTRTVVREIDPGFLLTGLFFSEDGQILVTSTVNPKNEICLWRVADGSRLAGIPAGATGRVGRGSQFAVSRDLSQVAYDSLDGKIHLLDLTTGNERWSARAAEEMVLALAFSPDGKVLASGAGYNESAIRLWDVRTGAELGRLEGSRRGVVQLVFWPDGKKLASTGFDRTIRIWDVSERRLIRTLRGHTQVVNSLVLLSDQRRLVSGSIDGTVMFWDGTADKVKSVVTRIPGVPAVWRFSESGDAIIAIDESGRVTERRGIEFRDEKTLLEIGQIGSAVMAGDCPLLAAASAGRVRVWDWNRGMLVRELVSDGAGEFAPVRFLGKGKTLLIRRFRTDETYWLEEWELATGRRTRDWKLPANGGILPEVSPDEKYFVSFANQGMSLRLSSAGNEEEALIRTELATGRETTLRAITRESQGSSFSADGTLFAVPGKRGFVDVVDVAAWRKVAALTGGIGRMHAMKFSSDGQRLVTGTGGNEAIILWDVNTCERVLTLSAPSSAFNSVALSPDGNLLAGRSAGVTLAGNSASGALYVWRAPSWTEIEAVEKQARAP